MEVAIYTTPTCPWSTQAKQWLRRHRVSFIEKDLEDSEDARDEILQKTSQFCTPTIDVDGQILIGFDEEKLAELTKRKK
ncbi:NrdH-redoxin [Candidatus Woesearchaeota archaeon]|nr:NrdH-redoxin [Candidatus Woesearchaeota archaeon]